MQIQQESRPYDEIKLAYAAGYFDGEGTVNVLSCKGNFQLRVELTLYDLDSLLVFEELFGGKVRSDEFAAVNFRVYRWAKNNRDAIGVLSAMVPFLRAKKKQAELARDSGWDFQTRGGPRLTEFQIERRAALHRALKEAKKDNKREKSPRSVKLK
jgi:hypothetical protein